MIVKPPQLRNPTQQLDQAGPYVIRQGGSHTAQVIEDIISNLHTLGDGEVVPVVRNEPGEAARRQQQRVGVFGVVQYVLALRNPFGGGLKAEELVLRVAARGFVDGVVQCLA